MQNPPLGEPSNLTATTAKAAAASAVPTADLNRHALPLHYSSSSPSLSPSTSSAAPNLSKFADSIFEKVILPHSHDCDDEGGNEGDTDDADPPKAHFTGEIAQENLNAENAQMKTGDTKRRKGRAVGGVKEREATVLKVFGNLSRRIQKGLTSSSPSPAPTSTTTTTDQPQQNDTQQDNTRQQQHRFQYHPVRCVLFGSLVSMAMWDGHGDIDLAIVDAKTGGMPRRIRMERRSREEKSEHEMIAADKNENDAVAPSEIPNSTADSNANADMEKKDTRIGSGDDNNHNDHNDGDDNSGDDSTAELACIEHIREALLLPPPPLTASNIKDDADGDGDESRRGEGEGEGIVFSPDALAIIGGARVPIVKYTRHSGNNTTDTNTNATSNQNTARISSDDGSGVFQEGEGEGETAASSASPSPSPPPAATKCAATQSANGKGTANADGEDAKGADKNADADEGAFPDIDFDITTRLLGARNSWLLRGYMLQQTRYTYDTDDDEEEDDAISPGREGGNVPPPPQKKKKRLVESHGPIARVGALVIKQWSKVSGVNNSTNGLLSSYGVMLLWCFFLIQKGYVSFIDPHSIDINTVPDIPSTAATATTDATTGGGGGGRLFIPLLDGLPSLSSPSSSPSASAVATDAVSSSRQHFLDALTRIVYEFFCFYTSGPMPKDMAENMMPPAESKLEPQQGEPQKDQQRNSDSVAHEESFSFAKHIVSINQKELLRKDDGEGGEAEEAATKKEGKKREKNKENSDDAANDGVASCPAAPVVDESGDGKNGDANTANTIGDGDNADGGPADKLKNRVNTMRALWGISTKVKNKKDKSITFPYLCIEDPYEVPFRNLGGGKKNNGVITTYIMAQLLRARAILEEMKTDGETDDDDADDDDDENAGNDGNEENVNNYAKVVAKEKMDEQPSIGETPCAEGKGAAFHWPKFILTLLESKEKEAKAKRKTKDGGEEQEEDAAAAQEKDEKEAAVEEETSSPIASPVTKDDNDDGNEDTDDEGRNDFFSRCRCEYDFDTYAVMIGVPPSSSSGASESNSKKSRRGGRGGGGGKRSNSKSNRGGGGGDVDADDPDADLPLCTRTYCLSMKCVGKRHRDCDRGPFCHLPTCRHKHPHGWDARRNCPQQRMCPDTACPLAHPPGHDPTKNQPDCPKGLLCGNHWCGTRRRHPPGHDFRVNIDCKFSIYCEDHDCAYRHSIDVTAIPEVSYYKDGHPRTGVERKRQQNAEDGDENERDDAQNDGNENNNSNNDSGNATPRTRVPRPPPYNVAVGSGGEDGRARRANHKADHALNDDNADGANSDGDGTDDGGYSSRSSTIATTTTTTAGGRGGGSGSIGEGSGGGGKRGRNARRRRKQKEMREEKREARRMRRALARGEVLPPEEQKKVEGGEGEGEMKREKEPPADNGTAKEKETLIGGGDFEVAAEAEVGKTATSIAKTIPSFRNNKLSLPPIIPHSTASVSDAPSSSAKVVAVGRVDVENGERAFSLPPSSSSSSFPAPAPPAFPSTPTSTSSPRRLQSMVAATQTAQTAAQPTSLSSSSPNPATSPARPLKLPSL